MIKEKELNTKHPWYVARDQGGLLYANGKSTFNYPFGGTLEECKAFIDNAATCVRHLFTWVPQEFVEDDLFNNVTYPL